MKIRLVFLGMLFSQLLLAQNTNSDLVQLQNHPQKDTTRCFLLNKVIEAENDQNIWIKYNQELRKIAVDQLQKENNKTVKNTNRLPFQIRLITIMVAHLHFKILELHLII